MNAIVTSWKDRKALAWAMAASILFSSALGAQLQTSVGPESLPIAPQSALVTPETATSPASSLGKWNNALSIGANVLTGTQTQQSYTGRLSSHMDSNGTNGGAGDRIANLAFSTNYTDAKQTGSPAVLTQMYEAKGQFDWFFADHAFLYTVADLYHNYSLGVYLQQSYGGGIGYFKPVTLRDGFQFSADVRFIGEHLSAPGTPPGLAGAMFLESYTHRFLLGESASKPVLAETIEVIPAFNDVHALEMRGTLALVVPLTDKLSIQLQEFDDFLRNAPRPARQNYQGAQFTFNVSWSNKKGN